MATLELVVSEFVVLAVVCFFLIRYYKGNMVTPDVAIAVYLSWVLGFAGILLLPYDISVALVDDKQMDTLNKVWNFIYWSTFFLAWAVLPMQMEYHNSGQFTFSEKMKDALKKNVWMGVLAAVAGTTYVVYMVVTKKGSLSQVIGFVKAMGNTYGILLITVLMGNGLVGLPRRMWFYADTEGELNLLYMMASGIEESYQEARYELEDCEWDVTKASEALRRSSAGGVVLSESALQAVQYVKIMQKNITDFTFSGRSTTKNNVGRSAAAVDKVQGLSLPPDMYSKSDLVEMHARLKQSHIRARACERRWKHLIRQCEVAELAVAEESSTGAVHTSSWCLMQTQGMSLAPEEKSLHNTLKASIFNCIQVIGNSFIRICTAKCMKTSYRILSVLCGVVSVTILWSELFLAAQWRSPMGYFMGAYGPQGQLSALAMQGVSFFALSYMSICTYWSLFRLNLGWAYTLQGPQLSPPSSLIFNGEYFSRLQFALGYNFLMFLNIPGTSNTAFDQLMSNMTMVPVFGTSFQVYIPIVTILVSLLTVFNVNARVLHLIGVESDDLYVKSFNCSPCCRSRTKVALNDEDQERYELGKKLVASELRSSALATSKAQQTLNSTPKSQSHSHPGSRNGSRGSTDIESTRSAFSSSNGSWLTNHEKDEAPYRDEEADDDLSEGLSLNRGFKGFPTEGVRDGHHKKSNSINDITNQIKSSSSDKYSSPATKASSDMHSHGMMSISESAAHDGVEAFSGSSAWTAKNLVSKLSGAFSGVSSDRSLMKTTPPLSQGNSTDALESSSRYKGVFEKDMRALSSSQPHYVSMRNTEFSSDFDGVPDRSRTGISSNYKKLDSPFTSSSNTTSSASKSAGLSSMEAPYSQRREKPTSNNFGLEEAPDEQFYGRRYSNI